MKDEDKTEKQLPYELININILDVISDPISVQDIDFRVLHQNKAHKDLIGDHTGELCYKAYQNRDQLCRKCHLAMAFKDGKIHIVEQSRVTDKGARYSENSAYPLKDSTGKLVAGMEIVRDITERKEAENALKKTKEELEIKVKKRTSELEKKNIALKELIKHVDVEKNKLKEDISININRTLMPIITELETCENPHKYIGLLKLHLEELQSTFGRSITDSNYNLTAREVEICNLIKGGARSKDISNLLNVSPETVEKHRKNIRKKVGISNKKVNLFYFLQKM